VSILANLKKDIAYTKLRLQKLETAYSVLEAIQHDIDFGDTYEDPEEDQTEVTPAPPSPSPVTNPVPPPKPPRFVMLCSACNDEMYRAYKRVPSGITVEYWQCGNGQCNNEMY
jgi:hypothetical protein